MALVSTDEQALAGTAQRCPAGGPGCDSRTRELHVNTGPMGASVGYYTCPRCGWVGAPFTIPAGEEPPAL